MPAIDIINSHYILITKIFGCLAIQILLVFYVPFIDCKEEILKKKQLINHK
jgi:hypothetical protein